MLILNLGCGAVRPPDPFVNIDNLHAVLAKGTPERAQLDSEPNYLNHDISQPLPFEDEAADSLMLSHVIEHFDCHGAVALLRECHRVLKPGGVLVVSVPDASIFRLHHADDTIENAQALFGESINLADGETDFMGYALFYREHKQVLTADALWCLLVRAGFSVPESKYDTAGYASMKLMGKHLNRRQFSLEMIGVKE